VGSGIFNSLYFNNESQSVNSQDWCRQKSPSTFYIHTWSGPEKCEMESGPVKNVGAPPHSENYMNMFNKYLMQMNIDERPRMNKTTI
jgi:hypothetical protein